MSYLIMINIINCKLGNNGGISVWNNFAPEPILDIGNILQNDEILSTN